MKNLHRTADGELNNSRFVWQELPNSEEVAAITEEARERLNYLIKEKKYSDIQVNKIALDAKNLVNNVQSDIEVAFAAKDIDKAAQLTVFSGKTSEARKVARVELITMINNGHINTGTLDPAQISNFMELAMRPLKCKGGVREYIGIAYKMVKYGDTRHIPANYLEMFNSYEGRNELADLMEEGGEATFNAEGNMIFGGKTYDVVALEVLMGGAMTDVDKRFLSKFELKNVIPLGAGKFMGFMSNGCEGNLVIIDTKEEECEPDCNDKTVTERVGTAEESKNEYEKIKKKTDQSEKAVNEAFAEYWLGKDSLIKEFRKDLDGAFMEGGLIGILQGLERSVRKKYKHESKEYEMMEERIFSTIKITKQANKVKSDAIRRGVWDKNKELLLSDIITTAIGLALGGGIGSIVLTNIKLPKSIFGSKLEELPGMNDVFTSLDGVAGTSYTEKFKEYVGNMDKERLAYTNAAKFEGEDVENQNAFLSEELSRDLQTSISGILEKLEERSDVLEGEAKIGRRTAKLGLLSGDRIAINKARKTLENFQENPDSVSTEEVKGAMDDILEILIPEFNKDFDQNLINDELSKRLRNGRIMTFDFKTASVQVKLQEFERTIGDNTKTITSWNHNITIDNVEYGKPGPDGEFPEGVTDINTLKDMEGEEGRVARRMYKRAQNQMKKLLPRFAMVKELHWMSSQMNDMIERKDVREVDKAVFDIEGEETAQQNVESSADYSRITYMERLYKENPATVAAIFDCYFAESRDVIKTFFDTDYANKEKKGKAWAEVLAHSDFDAEMTNYRTVVKKAVEDGKIYDEDGKICVDAPEELYARFKAGEKFYYDDVVGEKAHRSPIIGNFLIIFQKGAEQLFRDQVLDNKNASRLIDVFKGSELQKQEFIKYLNSDAGNELRNWTGLGDGVISSFTDLGGGAGVRVVFNEGTRKFTTLFGREVVSNWLTKGLTGTVKSQSLGAAAALLGYGSQVVGINFSTVVGGQKRYEAVYKMTDEVPAEKEEEIVKEKVVEEDIAPEIIKEVEAKEIAKLNGIALDKLVGTKLTIQDLLDNKDAFIDDAKDQGVIWIDDDDAPKRLNTNDFNLLGDNKDKKKYQVQKTLFSDGKIKEIYIKSEK